MVPERMGTSRSKRKTEAPLVPEEKDGRPLEASLNRVPGLKERVPGPRQSTGDGGLGCVCGLFGGRGNKKHP